VLIGHRRFDQHKLQVAYPFGQWADLPAATIGGVTIASAEVHIWVIDLTVDLEPVAGEILSRDEPTGLRASRWLTPGGASSDGGSGCDGFSPAISAWIRPRLWSTAPARAAATRRTASHAFQPDRRHSARRRPATSPWSP
jgi:hypothetical protein